MKTAIYIEYDDKGTVRQTGTGKTVTNTAESRGKELPPEKAILDQARLREQREEERALWKMRQKFLGGRL